MISPPATLEASGETRSRRPPRGVVHRSRRRTVTKTLRIAPTVASTFFAISRLFHMGRLVTKTGFCPSRVGVQHPGGDDLSLGPVHQVGQRVLVLGPRQRLE